jgi:hypothetical protein
LNSLRIHQAQKKADRPADLGPMVGEVNSRRKGVGELAVLREIRIAVGSAIRWHDQRLATIKDGLERD